MFKDYCTPERRKGKRPVWGLGLLLLTYLAATLWVANRAGINIIL